MAEYTFSPSDIQRHYDDLCVAVDVALRFESTFNGGQPATPDGIHAYVKFQLGLTPGTPEFDAAVKRISEEEVGTKDVTPDTGEVEEEKTYGINVIRRDDKGGPYMLPHQIKANIKQAASRANVFISTKGAKGDLAEVSRVSPRGESAIEGETQKIYFLDANGKRYGPEHKRVWERLQGRVRTAQGERSIVVNAETLPVGSMLQFRLQFPAGRITIDDLRSTFALAQEAGLGSGRSLERGKFRIIELKIKTPDRAPKAGKGKKKGKEEPVAE